jgi:drug/metabolite transporter (DMT)-like permease
MNCAPQAVPAGRPAAGRETRSRAFTIGVTLALTNTIIGAGQPALTRWGATNLDPLLFCTGAVVIAALFCVVLMYSRGELKLVFGRAFRLQLAMMSATGTMATSLLLTFGMTRINAIGATILLQSEPIYSLLLAIIVVRERPSNRQLLATATILLGIGSVYATGGAFTPAWAALLVLITPLLWQTSHVMGLSMMPPLSPLAVTSGRMIYAALGLGTLLILARPATLPELANVSTLAIIVVTGFFIYFLSALTWYGAISRLSLAWTTALVVPAIPLLSILFAVVFLGERATVWEILGVLIAIAGVLALVLGADAHRQHPGGDAVEAVHQPLT